MLISVSVCYDKFLVIHFNASSIFFKKIFLLDPRLGALLTNGSYIAIKFNKVHGPKTA